MSEPHHIAIVALRRSGTTTLWRLFRQDRRYRCYDEPFSRLLGDLPAEGTKQVRTEFIELFNRDPAKFRAAYAPILRSQETTREMTPAQKSYLRFLAADMPIVFDETRCMGKIAELRDVLSEAVLVHLHRHPAAFATSHLLPTDGHKFWGLRALVNRRTFFDRSYGYNGWGMEELSRTDHVETTRALLAEVDVALPPRTKRVPAAQRLLTLWLGAYRLAEREGPRHFGARFVSLGFESLCADPAASLAAIYARACVPPCSIDVSGVRPAAPGFAVNDPRWRALAAEAGFDAGELARFFPKAPA